jgi:acetyl esterase/lipase
MKTRLPALLLGCLLLAGLVASTAAQEKTGQAKKLGQFPAAPDGVQALRNLEYVSGSHERQRLDLYLPEKGEKFPVVVWVHGGSWKSGSKDLCPAVRMTTNGYAVASLNYRLSQHAPFPAQIEDCKAAIRWLRANAAKHRLDPEHVGVWGASAGGHLVTLLGLLGEDKEFDKGENLKSTSRVSAVCDFFGPTDFTALLDTEYAKRDGNTLSQLFGGSLAEHREMVGKASPMKYPMKDAPPFLIMHGTEDKLVQLRQSRMLEESLKKAGVEAKLHVIQGAGHGTPEFRAPEVYAMIDTFFDRHLKGTASK